MKKSELRQIIREELQKEFFNFKKKPETKPQPPQPRKVSPGEITIEGISATGKGYSIWKGNNPIGDLRGMIRKYTENGFGNIIVDGNDFDYYYVTKQNTKSLKDHVGRPAYFTVSALKESVSKDTLKSIADDILNKNKNQEGIKIF